MKNLPITSIRIILIVALIIVIQQAMGWAFAGSAIAAILFLTLRRLGKDS